jgi:hypothetical protein
MPTAVDQYQLSTIYQVQGADEDLQPPAWNLDGTFLFARAKSDILPKF